MLHYQRLADEWLPILVSLVLSTALTIAISALVLRLLIRRSAKPQAAP
jgi:holin-like protein